jgi:hypothetical protein
LEVLVVDPADDVRTGQDQQVVVAPYITLMAGKPVAPEPVFRELLALDHRAHRTVEHKNPFCEEGVELF